MSHASTHTHTHTHSHRPFTDDEIETLQALGQFATLAAPCHVPFIMSFVYDIVLKTATTDDDLDLTQVFGTPEKILGGLVPDIPFSPNTAALLLRSPFIPGLDISGNGDGDVGDGDVGDVGDGVVMTAAALADDMPQRDLRASRRMSRKASRRSRDGTEEDTEDISSEDDDVAAKKRPRRVQTFVAGSVLSDEEGAKLRALIEGLPDDDKKIEEKTDPYLLRNNVSYLVVNSQGSAEVYMSDGTIRRAVNSTGTYMRFLEANQIKTMAKKCDITLFGGQGGYTIYWPPNPSYAIYTPLGMDLGALQTTYDLYRRDITFEKSQSLKTKRSAVSLRMYGDNHDKKPIEQHADYRYDLAAHVSGPPV